MNSWPPRLRLLLSTVADAIFFIFFLSFFSFSHFFFFFTFHLHASNEARIFLVYTFFNTSGIPGLSRLQPLFRTVSDTTFFLLNFKFFFFFFLNFRKKRSTKPFSVKKKPASIARLSC